jgi:hypothetical protein
MPAYPKTGSTLDYTTRSALSTQMIIMVGNEPVGAVQSFNISQNRSLKEVTEIGTDGIIEIVPQSANKVSLKINRMYFDGISLPEAFSRGFRNLQSQRIPFDIVVIDQTTGTGDNAIIETYHNCWFESLSQNFSSDNYTIVQDASVRCEYISTIRGGEAVSLSQGAGGSRQVPVQLDAVELAADSGNTRGSLDYPGLISAAY